MKNCSEIAVRVWFLNIKNTLYEKFTTEKRINEFTCPHQSLNEVAKDH